MAIYVMQARSADEASLVRARAVRDGFSWGALVFAQLWLLAYRLWLALAVWVVLEIAFFCPGLSPRLRPHGRARRWAGPPFYRFRGQPPADRQARAAGSRDGRRRGEQPGRGGGAVLRRGHGGHPAVSVAVVDYGSGNLHSAVKALERAAREAAVPVTLTADPDVVARADHIVLPGVGAFADCRAGLDAVPGLVAALSEAVRGRGRPFLGICVGMQLLATRGLENGDTAGLDWIPGSVAAIKPADPRLKIPHMGWNTLDARRDHPILAGVPTGPEGLHAYFVHSYALDAARPEDVVATADYAGAITAIVARDTVVGTQFHPEKSQRLGLALLANFLRWRP